MNNHKRRPFRPRTNKNNFRGRSNGTRSGGNGHFQNNNGNNNDDNNINVVLLNQTHSNKVIVVNKKNQKNKSFKSDAIITKMSGYGLGVVTADCVPIILYDVENGVIGCVHAGWKGAISGVIENTLKKFRKLNLNNKIYASIGPCIGKKSYEVDLYFYKKFILKSKVNSIYFVSKNKKKKLFNLRKYVADKLLKLDEIRSKNGLFNNFFRKNFQKT